MTLLEKLQNKMHKKEPNKHIKTLNKQPDKEKLKILDYLSSIKDIKDLHRDEQ